MSEDHVIISKPVREIADPLLDLVEKTYTSSFPEEDVVISLWYVSFWRKIAASRCMPCYGMVFMSVSLPDGNLRALFMRSISRSTSPLVTEESEPKAMTSFLALHEDPVVLEVEMPTEEMSKRRIGFYERLGFVLDHHVYFQPPYRKGEAFLEMRLMTHGELDLEQSFERVKTIIHQNVYGVE